jgi:hypothetical protein
MKDHSETDEERKRYILSYEIKDNNIIVNLASGKKQIFSYSGEAEKRIIDKMEEQAYEAYSSYDTGKIDRKFWEESIVTAIGVSFPTIAVMCMIFGIIDPGSVSTLSMAFLDVDAAAAIALLIFWKVRKRDAQKLEYFMDRKEDINNAIKEDETITLGLSKKAIKEVEMAKAENKEPITLNNIDNYSLNDLRAIRDNMALIRRPNCRDIKRRVLRKHTGRNM